MSYATLRADIEGRFSTNWTYTAVAWQNKTFDPAKKDDVGTFDINLPWVRLTVNNGESNQASIEGSSPLKRALGIISVQVFTQPNVGGGLSDTYVDNVAAIFEDQSFGGVICRATSKRVIGHSRDCYQVNANTTFTFDYT